MFYHGARGCFLQCFTGTVGWTSHVEVQRFVKELFLVSKSSVKARPGNAHGCGQFGERSAGIPSAPKYLQGFFQSYLRIKGAWTTDPRGKITDFHTDR